MLRVAVFRCADGAVLFEAAHGARARRPLSTRTLPTSKAVWALVRALLPLARTLDGGGLRTALLRAADPPSDARAFGAAQPRAAVQIVVAHGALLAVALTIHAHAHAKASATARTICDRLHKYILTKLLSRPASAAPAAEAEAPAPTSPFDLQAYMQSFADSDRSSSFFSSELSEDATSTTLSHVETPEAPLIEIDSAPLQAEVAAAVAPLL